MNLDTTPFDVADRNPMLAPMPQYSPGQYSPPGQYAPSGQYAPMPQYSPGQYPPSGQYYSAAATSSEGSSIKNYISGFFSYIFGMSRTAYIVIAVIILMVMFIPAARDIADTTIRGILFALIILGVIYIANKF